MSVREVARRITGGGGRTGQTWFAASCDRCGMRLDSTMPQSAAEFAATWDALHVDCPAPTTRLTTAVSRKLPAVLPSWLAWRL